jgi:hypothetical protein
MEPPRYCLAVDSESRDIIKFPSRENYIVNLDRMYRNVTRVELVFAIYEKVTNDLYVNLFIEELGGNLDANNDALKSAFTQLPLATSLNSYEKVTYNKSHYVSDKRFVKPLAKLPKLSIKFLNSQGQLTPIGKHLLRFEIEVTHFDNTVPRQMLPMSWDAARKDYLQRMAIAKHRGDTVAERDLKRALKEVANTLGITPAPTRST